MAESLIFYSEIEKMISQAFTLHDLKTRKHCELNGNYIIYGLRTSHKKPNCFTTRNLFLISDLISTVFMFRLKKMYK